MAQLIQFFRRNAAAEDRPMAMVSGRRGANICRRQEQRAKSGQARHHAYKLQNRVMVGILANLNPRPS